MRYLMALVTAGLLIGLGWLFAYSTRPPAVQLITVAKADDVRELMIMNANNDYPPDIVTPRQIIADVLTSIWFALIAVGLCLVVAVAAPQALPKMILAPVLLVAACVVAGLYGMLHNQISYSVSPDYFHAFKFIQFRIPEDLQNRLGASVVGWHASWWMGLIIGIPVLLIALILPGWRAYLSGSLMAFAVVA